MKRLTVMIVICLSLTLTGVISADMNDDPEAQELLASFRAMQETSRYLDDSFDGEAKGTITGPISFGPGVNADKNEADKAALFPETKEKAVYIYYGPYVPLRGRYSLDFKAGTRLTLRLTIYRRRITRLFYSKSAVPAILQCGSKCGWIAWWTDTF